MPFEKPNIPPLTLPEPIRTRCVNILPLDLHGYTSDYELLCYLLRRVKELIAGLDQTNSAVNELIVSFNKLVDYVDQYFAGLDITEELNKLLQQLADEGFFDTIAKYLYCPSQLNYEWKRFTGHKHYYNIADNISAIYESYQGFTNTNNTFLAMLIPIEYKFNYVNGYITDLAVIVEYDKNFNEIRRSSPLKLYHGQSMFYYNGKIYVDANNSGETQINKILVVDYQTLTILNEIDLDVPSNWIFVKDDFMYTGTRSHLEKRNLNDGTLISSTPLSNLPILFSCKPFGNMYLATMNYPNTVVLLDSDFNIMKYFSLYGFPYAQGEIKDIAYMNGDIYINYNDRSYQRTSNYELTETYIGVMCLNLQKNKYQSNLFIPSDYSNNSTAYVNTASNAVIENGSSTAPFSTVLQAVRHGYKAVNIVNSDGCYIFGTGLEAFISSDKKANILYLGTISGSKITGSNFTVSESVQPTTLRGCTLYLPNVNFTSPITANYSDLNFDTSEVTVNSGALNTTALPLSASNSPIQKWDLISSDNNTNLGISSFSNYGAYFIRARITADGIVFIANTIACGNNINQYIVTCTENGGNNKTLTGYLTFTITDGVMKAQIYNPQIDGTSASTFSVDSFRIIHII